MRSLIAIFMVTCLIFASAAFAEEDPDKVRLNLREVDIRTLIDSVADLTSRNFLIDPRVKGKVTVVSSHEMDPEDLYAVFLSVLQVHGYTAIPAGKVIKIVPDSSARESAVSLYGRQPGYSEAVETLVIAVQQVPAKDIVPVLRNLMPKDAHVAAYEPSNSLIVTDRAANLARMQDIVRRIDRPGDNAIEVIRLEHASASSVAAILSGLGAGKGVASAQQIMADERTNSIMIRAEQVDRVRLRGLVAHLDVPLETTGSYKVIFLRYAKVEQLAPLLNEMLTQQAGGSAAPARKTGKDSGMSIHADTHNNALVVQAPPDVMRDIESLVRQLDIRRAQVLVEAVIAEVSSDVSRELGVQFVAGSTEGNRTPAAITNLGSQPLAGLAQGIINQTLTLGSGAFVGFGDFTSGGNNWGVLINALAGDAQTNILSTPTIVATDNQEAEIVVGQNVPFVTGQYTSTGPTGNTLTNPFQTIERQDIGITLRIRPQINEGSSVQMEIEQEVSSLAASSAGASDLVTNKRAISTTVTVEDGQIIALGGLIEDRVQNSEQAVPVLGEIPGLGALFRYESSQKVKQNLMVFLRPVILRDPAIASGLSARKYSHLRALQTTIREEHPHRGLVTDPPPKLPTSVEKVLDTSRGEIFDPLNDVGG